MEFLDRISVRSPLHLVIAVVFCLVVGSLGSVFTVTGAGSWYGSLSKPFFTPPNWVFAPVWITLFILMGIALYLVWEAGIDRREVRVALAVFGVQFILNVLWSFLFFGLQSPWLGLIDIVLLWIMIAAMIVLFSRISRVAACLLIPYICWVTIAGALNAGVYLLNP